MGDRHRERAMSRWMTRVVLTYSFARTTSERLTRGSRADGGRTSRASTIAAMMHRASRCGEGRGEAASRGLDAERSGPRGAGQCRAAWARPNESSASPKHFRCRTRPSTVVARDGRVSHHKAVGRATERSNRSGVFLAVLGASWRARWRGLVLECSREGALVLAPRGPRATYTGGLNEADCMGNGADAVRVGVRG